MNLFKIGETAYLARDIFGGSTDEYTTTIFGFKGEEVEIIDIKEGESRYRYRVKGRTNSNTWLCSSIDLMWSPPFDLD